MEEITRLLKENNMMLKAICQYLANQEGVNIINNLITDIIANKITHGNI